MVGGELFNNEEENNYLTELAGFVMRINQIWKILNILSSIT